jgi:pimeloyl-ACP methyl ester carboxylesterase
MIHFAHANGFPSDCYHMMFNELRVAYDVNYVSMVGHSDDYPISENWSHLVDELIESVMYHRQSPVVGVGHSLGGVLTLLAASKRPDLFKQVILLDAPVFGFSKSMTIRLIKGLGLIHLATPSKRSAKRKAIWNNLEEAKAYFLKKPLYQSFHPECLEDYLQHALIQRADKKYQLRFCREKESLIFKTVPHSVYRNIKKLSVPVSLIYSESSHIITAYELRNMKKKFGVITYACKGSHLFPLEHPKQTAALIQNAIECSIERKKA